MSFSPLTSPSPGVDPALRAAGLAELDAALARLDEVVGALGPLREAYSWESEGARALRLALARLADDAAGARAMVAECRMRTEAA